ncbi:MAG: PDZ domain-containing protein [Acetobacteraceae bacterium]|nr:PDZ domain-containing protein [Acetobacteraceae bacterium]
MNQAWLLLLLVALAAPFDRAAQAEPFSAGSALSQPLVAQVTATAFDFMAPRTLEAISIPQMALWGLRGLTTLDARLTPDLQPDTATLRLIGPSRVLLKRPAPPADNAAEWGAAVAQMARAAWDGSEPVRRAGTQGILRAFFDELFNHLDPYSRYATPAEAAAERARRIGRATIGLQATLRGGQVLVAAVQPGGPAALGGVRPGERIMEIDGEPVEGADLVAITALLAGPEGSMVTLDLHSRTGSRVVVLRREALPQETVTTARHADLLVIRISSFANNTAARLAQELIAGTAAAPPPSGVVLDLRGNRGGVLRQAVAAVAMLQPTGVVAATSGRDPAAAVEYRADGGRDLAPGLPVVVIVDGRSASAAEVMAAALADHGRAVVVGSTTLGKGLVQTISPLPDGGELFITWSRLLAPRGWPLQGLGVVPQLCTSLGEDSLQRNLAALSAGRQPMRTGLERHNAARAPLAPSEVLEIRAICPAAEGGDLDLVAASALVRTPSAYAAALFPPIPPRSPPRSPSRSPSRSPPGPRPAAAPASLPAPSGLTGTSVMRN